MHRGNGELQKECEWKRGGKGSKKRVVEIPAPAEANPLRRAVFFVPILGVWLPLSGSGYIKHLKMEVRESNT